MKTYVRSLPLYVIDMFTFSALPVLQAVQLTNEKPNIANGAALNASTILFLTRIADATANMMPNRIEQCLPFFRYVYACESYRLAFSRI